MCFVNKRRGAGRGHRRVRLVGGDGGFNAGGADEPPGGNAQGAGGDRRSGRRRGQDRRRGGPAAAALRPYPQAAFKETLRLHPAAPIAHRVSTGEVAVGGFAVPPRAAVFINVWAIGRDPAVWEDPPAFRPERFLPGGAAAAGLEPRGQHAQFMPFGGGRRGCPGVGLAQQSVPAALAALVQCFDWAVADGETGVVDMDESEVGLVCARKHPLLLRPTARLNPFPAVV